MSKLKHNKKRNTAFLYEVLVKELAKAVFQKDAARQKTLKDVLKEHFGPNTLLRQELRLYQELAQSVCEDSKLAERILQEAKVQHQTIDKEKLQREQSNLLFKMKKVAGTGIWSNFVPNYTTLASIAQIFGTSATVKSKVLLEGKIVEQMTAPKTEKPKLDPIDSLVMKQFVKRFNETYGSLHEEQTKLLQKFVLSFSDRDPDLLLYLNEEVRRLKKEMEKVAENQEIKNDPMMFEKAEKVKKLLNEFKGQKPNAEMIEKVLKIQELVREVQA